MVTDVVAATEQEWRDLYRAADAFKKLAPWEWMLDSDIFGVRNPETNEVGYCCVMGNLGEHFALGVYLGDEGLRGLIRLSAGEFWPPDIGGLFIQHALMASWEDREQLSQRDRDQIKALGLKYRGRNAWPMFRNLTPGYVPWYLTGAEARFLTVSLGQAGEVAEQFAHDRHVLEPPVDGQVLVRVSENGVWTHTWHTPDLVEPPAGQAPPLDESRLERLTQSGLRRGGTWETDRVWSPGGVQDGRDERPYYPMICLVVDKGSGMILPPLLTRPEDWRAAYQDHMLTLVEQVGVIPTELAMRTPEIRDLLLPLASALGAKVSVGRRLKALDEASGELLGVLGRF